jgi:hypothetical protein
MQLLSLPRFSLSHRRVPNGQAPGRLMDPINDA